MLSDGRKATTHTCHPCEGEIRDQVWKSHCWYAVRRSKGKDSEVDGKGSEVDGKGSEVGGRGSEVDGKGSEADGKGSEVDGDAYMPPVRRREGEIRDLHASQQKMGLGAWTLYTQASWIRGSPRCLAPVRPMSFSPRSNTVRDPCPSGSPASASVSASTPSSPS
eukprot:8403745-Pyramimonas_sp.AAC.2